MVALLYTFGIGVIITLLLWALTWSEIPPKFLERFRSDEQRQLLAERERLSRQSHQEYLRQRGIEIGADDALAFYKKLATAPPRRFNAMSRAERQVWFRELLEGAESWKHPHLIDVGALCDAAEIWHRDGRI